MEEKTNEPVWNGNTATVLNSKGHFGSPQPPQQQKKLTTTTTTITKTMNNRLAKYYPSTTISHLSFEMFPPFFVGTSLSGTGGVVNNVGAGVICTTGILDPVLRGTCQGTDVWGTGGVVPGNKLGKLPTIGVLRATSLGVKGSDATGATGATMGSTSGVGGRGVVARLVAEGEVNLGNRDVHVFITHRIHVWYNYLHSNLTYKSTKRGETYNTWIHGSYG